MSKEVGERPAGLREDAPRFERVHDHTIWWKCSVCDYQFPCNSSGFASITCPVCHGPSYKE